MKCSRNLSVQVSDTECNRKSPACFIELYRIWSLTAPLTKFPTTVPLTQYPPSRLHSGLRPVSLPGGKASSRPPYGHHPDAHPSASVCCSPNTILRSCVRAASPRGHRDLVSRVCWTPQCLSELLGCRRTQETCADPYEAAGSLSEAPVLL